MRLGEEVAELDAERHLARLSGGGSVEYGRLLLATGARARPLAGHPGADLMTLRDIEDADRLRAALAGDRPLQVVGAGFIGCEVAAAARRLDRAVTVYEAFPQPLLRVLGPELGAWLADVHRDHGVDLHLGVTELPDLTGPVLAAVGSRPNTELAERSGIACDAGVLVDGFGRTDAPGVYAAGDCARFWSPLFEAHVRVEHFQTALRHGEAVGRAMAGQGRPFAEAPWFWSDQYDVSLQYVGAGLPWDSLVVMGRLGTAPFTVCYMGGGRLLAAAAVNDHRRLARLRRLMELRVDVTADQLQDPAVDLKRLAASASAAQEGRDRGQDVGQQAGRQAPDHRAVDG